MVRHGSTPAPSSEAEMLTSRSVTTVGIALVKKLTYFQHYHQQ
ncbi:hypothetical protein [Nostoc sp. PCC 9305]